MWKDKPYDERSDIWSLGCVLYEIITLKPPFRANDMQGLYRKVTRGQYAKISSAYSQDLAALLAQLLQVNAKMRPSCKQILELYSVQKRAQLIQRKEASSKSLLESQLLPPDDLLGTIKVPRNLHNLEERLPKPNYQRNLSVPAHFPDVAAAAVVSPDTDKTDLRSDIASIEPQARRALHEKVNHALENAERVRRPAPSADSHSQAALEQQNKLVERYMVYKNRRESAAQPPRLQPHPPSEPRGLSRESELKSMSADNQENHHHRHHHHGGGGVYRLGNPRVPSSRKLLLPPRRADVPHNPHH